MPESWYTRFAALFTFYGVALAALVVLAVAFIYVAPEGLAVKWNLLVGTALLSLLCFLAGWGCRRAARRSGWPS